MATYYVSDVGGLDTNSGFLTSPFKTIAKAITTVATGDTIEIRGGTYRESISASVTLKNITIKAYTGERPVIDGEYIRSHGVSLSSSGQTGWRFDGLEVMRVTDCGMEIYGSKGVNNNVIVENCIIHHVFGTDLYQHGIRFAYGNPTARNNLVHHIGQGGEAEGIWFGYCHNHVCDRNEIVAARKDGIRDYLSLNGTITNNRVMLCWTGIAANESVSPLVANNMVSFNQNGMNIKHLNGTSGRSTWNLTLDQITNWGRFWHNTLYRNTHAGTYNGPNAPPNFKVDIRNNIFAGVGSSYIWDEQSASSKDSATWRQDYNVYAPGARAAVWRNEYGSGGGSVYTTLAAMQTGLGYDLNGREIDPQLNDPDAGDLDYPDTSPVASGGVSLDSAWGSQVGARNLPDPRMVWTPHAMTVHASKETEAWRLPNRINAIDGKALSVFQARSGEQWLSVDLGTAKTIDHFVYDPYAHGSSSNFKGYRFEVSNDATDWTIVEEGAHADDRGAQWKHEIDPVSARYVRIWCLSNWLAEPSEKFFSDIRVGTLSGTAYVPPDEEPTPDPDPEPPVVVGGGYWGIRL